MLFLIFGKYNLLLMFLFGISGSPDSSVPRVSGPISELIVTRLRIVPLKQMSSKNVWSQIKEQMVYIIVRVQ